MFSFGLGRMTIRDQVSKHLIDMYGYESLKLLSFEVVSISFDWYRLLSDEKLFYDNLKKWLQDSNMIHDVEKEKETTGIGVYKRGVKEYDRTIHTTYHAGVIHLHESFESGGGTYSVSITHSKHLDENLARKNPKYLQIPDLLRMVYGMKRKYPASYKMANITLELSLRDDVSMSDNYNYELLGRVVSTMLRYRKFKYF
ncbi:hypothetical protein [Moraxella porci]|nr:hypothetical protein [Moraxella porci]